MLHQILCLGGGGVVESQNHDDVWVQVICGRRYVGMMTTEPIGNYGVRLLFDDMHKTGIFTWDYLFHLGSNKFTLMRNYIKTLKKHGLSRDLRPLVRRTK
ncbi:unnamed protein product [Cuscuta epithymum]|uniref:Gamma-butyrobetaine hydroxylase-like N-terminal domain-containing protein n=1 Tax=Cuscuta epithymum TaxID=186058 RepID=A0AAV0EER5_9ASTE|nr:unnamed protein product [Cuscuta epithymum]